MIERIMERRNLLKATRKVMANGGSPGVDGMGTKGLHRYLEQHRDALVGDVLEGRYRRSPILGVPIPKGGGKSRQLGIPVVIDRMLQQAAAQVIAPQFEVEFKAHSYGFRPGRNAQQAVLQAQEYINGGCPHIVDTDLKEFFDRVQHHILLQLLYRKVKCRRTLWLVRQWLRAPIKIGGRLVKRRMGIPQGSPLSPLLSNIVLHELDRWLEHQGARYVRYADDFSVYVEDKRQARKMYRRTEAFLWKKLRLPINGAKSGVRRPVKFQLLGHGFVPTYRKGERGHYQLVATAKAWRRLKAALKRATRKTTPMSLKERLVELLRIQRGWVNYFRLASIQQKLKEVDGWVRNRLRYCIWHYWKKPGKKRRSLIRLGISPGQAYAWSRTRMGGWPVACSPILRTTITEARLRKRGYRSLSEHYASVSPLLNEPLYTRPVRTVV